MNGVSITPVLSIVIVTWNGKQYALECLESIYAHPATAPIEVIVVDNASSDGTPEAIATDFPNVRLIRNRQNLGFAKANNIGMAQSRGEYISLINSDVVVPEGCLAKMLAVMVSNADIGIMGPKMLYPDGSIGLSVMRLPTVWNTLCAAVALQSIFPNSRLFSGFSVRSETLGALADVQVVTGWFWLISRSAFDQVGGLDERFFMYGEDIDWCYRFKQAGWRVAFCGEAEALHYGGASSSDFPERSYVEMRRANRQFFRKHYGLTGSIGYTLAIAVHELARIAGYSLAYCYNRARRSEAKSKVRRSFSCLSWLLRGTSSATR